MTRVFPLASMSGLFLGLTVFLWALPLVFFAGQYWAPLPVVAPVGCFLVLIYGSVFLWWRPTRFEVSPGGLAVVFPLRRKAVAMGAITAVERVDWREFRRRYGKVVRVGAGGLWGGFGWLWRPGVWVEFYISRMDGLVLIDRVGAPPLLITPERPDELVALLAHRP